MFIKNDRYRSALRRRGLVLGALLLLASGGCAESVSRDELLRKMQEGASPLVVDVRTQSEYDRDHVPGAVHIPFYSIGGGLQALHIPKAGPIVLYCEHGPRAGIASFILSLSGYEKIYSLEGHMKGWRNNQFPIEIIKH